LTGLRGWFFGLLLFAFVLLFFRFGFWSTLIFGQLFTNSHSQLPSSNLTDQAPKLDRYVAVHVATTCDERGVYVTKDSAEVNRFRELLLSINYPPNIPVDKLSFSTNSVFTNSLTDARLTIIPACLFESVWSEVSRRISTTKTVRLWRMAPGGKPSLPTDDARCWVFVALWRSLRPTSSDKLSSATMRAVLSTPSCSSGQLLPAVHTT
jgi:hypothetical protein